MTVTKTLSILFPQFDILFCTSNSEVRFNNNYMAGTPIGKNELCKYTNTTPIKEPFTVLTFKKKNSLNISALPYY